MVVGPMCDVMPQPETTSRSKTSPTHSDLEILEWTETEVPQRSALLGGTMRLLARLLVAASRKGAPVARSGAPGR